MKNIRRDSYELLFQTHSPHAALHHGEGSDGVDGARGATWGDSGSASLPIFAELLRFVYFFVDVAFS
jgi:hypothetical protein